jgi:hypothetical protein
MKKVLEEWIRKEEWESLLQMVRKGWKIKYVLRKKQKRSKGMGKRKTSITWTDKKAAYFMYNKKVDNKCKKKKKKKKKK